MLSAFASGQAMMLGTVLATTAVLKAYGLSARASRPRPPTALDVLVGARRASALWAAIVAVETLLALLLFSGAEPRVAGLAAAWFFAGALGYLLLVRARVPRANCGCSGTLVSRPPRHQSMLGATALGVAAVAVTLANQSWTRALPWPVGPFLGIELVIVLRLLLAPALQARETGLAERAESGLAGAISLVKGSREFAARRQQLLSPLPADAWHDEATGEYFVFFALHPMLARAERLLGFAVEPRRERVVRVRELNVSVAAGTWQADVAEVP